MASRTLARPARSWRPWRGPVLTVWAALLLVDLAAQPFRAAAGAETTDWVAYATGARLIGSAPADLYSAAAQTATQTALLGHAPTIGLAQYPYPPLFAWLLQPLASLPLRPSLTIWSVLLLAAALGAAVLAAPLLPRHWSRPARAAAALTLAAGLASVDGVGYGQVDVLLLPAAVLAARLLVTRGDSAVAGVLLATLAVKPQLVWLLPIALLAARAWRTLAGLIAGIVAWGLSGALLAGPQAMRDWPDSLLHGYGDQTVRGAGIPSLLVDVGLPSSGATLAAVGGGLLAVAACVVLRGRLRADLATAAGAGLVAGALASPHLFPRDLALAALPLVVSVGWSVGAEAAVAVAIAGGVAFAMDDSMTGAPAHLTAVWALAALALSVRAARPTGPVRAGSPAAAKPPPMRTTAVGARLAVSSPPARVLAQDP